jgi:hypothetical protein
MPEKLTKLAPESAPSRSGVHHSLACRSISEAPRPDLEGKRAEVRMILVRLLVRSCMERRKAAA